MNGAYEVISELKNHLNFQQNIKIKSKLFRYIGNDSMKDAFWRILPGVAFIKTPFGALILSILVISIFASYSLGFGTSYSSGDQYYSNWVLGVRVSSYSQQGEPEFMVFVKDRGGRPLKVIYNVYAWMPDGGFEHLGFYGGLGIVKVNYSVVRAFSKVWRDHLVSRGNNPGMVLPGILLVGAIHEASGIYESFRGVPIRVVDILANKSVAVEVIEDLEGRKPLIGYNGSNSSRSSPQTPQNIKAQSSWPPESIFEWCNLECYYWILKEVYGYTTNMMPIVVTHVYGPGAYKINDVLQSLYFKSTSTVSIDVMITASVGKQGVGVIRYKVIGSSISLTGDNIWLDTYYSFINGLDFTPPAIVGIGFKAEFTAARYKLYKGSCDWSQCYPIYETDVESNMTFARPIITNNMMEPMRDVDPNPYDSQGALEIAYRHYRNYWLSSNTIIDSKSVLIHIFRVESELGTLPMFVLSGGVLGILCYSLGYSAAICSAISTIASIIGASIGATKSDRLYMYSQAYVSLKAEYVGNGYIYARYLYSPDAFEYQGGQYRIGSLYVDAYIS